MRLRENLNESFTLHIRNAISRPFHRRMGNRMTDRFHFTRELYVTTASFSRGKLVREASLTQADMNEVAKCRRDHNRLGFAYQIGFARLFNRFPAQQPLEINEELLSFVAVQMNIDSERISDYALWQHTVSEHQARIQQYLGLRPFDLDESNALERFAFEESCRLEQTALLLARAQEFLKGRRVVFPAESALLRLVGEQKKLAHESIVTRIADSFSPEMAETINRLLDISVRRDGFGAPENQGQSSEILCPGHERAYAQDGRNRSHRHSGNRSLMAERQLSASHVPLRPQMHGGSAAGACRTQAVGNVDLLSAAELPRHD